MKNDIARRNSTHMAEHDIIQSLISRLGQSQDDRFPVELGRHFVDIDERTPLDLLRHLAALAAKLRFYSRDATNADGTWALFFPRDEELAEALACQDGTVTPHLGLLVAFLRLYDEYPRQALNRLTGRHRDFQFQRVLGFVPRGAQPDRAHLLLELKKGVPSVAVPAGHEFTAVRDERGGERVYRAVRDVVINAGTVTDLKSIYHDGTRLRFSPRANSADGEGAPFTSTPPRWKPFGSSQLPEARIGFAVAAPVLRLAEGTRRVYLDLHLTGLDPQRHTSAALAAAFLADFSGAKEWIKAESLAAELTGGRLTITVTLSPSQPAVVDYDATVHGPAFDSQVPVLRILLRQDGPLSDRSLAGVTVESVRLRVEADLSSSVEVENDFGKLNAKKSFQPFGPQPVIGARFMIRCDEAFSKRWQRLDVTLTWQGAPPDLHEWYAGYERRTNLKEGIRARVSAGCLGVETPLLPRILLASGSTTGSTIRIEPPSAGAAQLTSPGGLGSKTLSKTSQNGVTIVLDTDLLHSDYLGQTVARALATHDGAKMEIASTGPRILKPPYSPTVQAISLSYAAESDRVDLNEGAPTNSFPVDAQYFHVGCFGAMRVHGSRRRANEIVADSRVSLLPHHDFEGELLIGVRDVGPGDSLSLLMQTAEGSGDPDLPPQNLQWFVLCDNDWRQLAPGELTLDTSLGLRTSGIVAVTLPAATTTAHTIMPSGLVWLRATVREHGGSACQLVQVSNNALEVVFVGGDNDSTHSSAALPANKITKLRSPLRSVKSVVQPFASYGGRTAENDDMLVRRAAERLRHRQRCVTAWDYERMVLEAFPSVHKVKCVPHAGDHSWTAPGHVMLIVVPDLRNQNAVDPLQPRVDAGTISQIAEFVRRHGGMQLRVLVRNPRYQRVKVSCLVRFRAGLPFHHYARQLDDTLVRILSPWAFDAASPIAFGGRIHRSVLLNCVEELPYVDFVTEFKLTSPDSSTPHADRSSVAAETPDAILISSKSHSIGEYKGT